MQFTISQMSKLADRYLKSKLGHGLDVNHLCLWINAPKGSVNEHLSQSWTLDRENPVNSSLEIYGSLITLVFENHSPCYMVQAFEDKTELQDKIIHGPYSILSGDISFVIVFENGEVRDYEIKCVDSDGREFTLTQAQMESGFSIQKQGELIKNGVELHWVNE